MDWKWANIALKYVLDSNFETKNVVGILNPNQPEFINHKLGETFHKSDF